MLDINSLMKILPLLLFFSEDVIVDDAFGGLFAIAMLTVCFCSLLLALLII
jgi:hypothetical protein